MSPSEGEAVQIEARTFRVGRLRPRTTLIHYWTQPIICKALGLAPSTRATLYKLQREHGLPLIRRPRGARYVWYTNSRLLDAWWIEMARQQRLVWSARRVRTNGGRKSGTASRPATPSEAV